jgi:glutathione-regulated potassium-efflux system ancillary protein KefC
LQRPEGFRAKAPRVPPLLGYLVAEFVFNRLGVEAGDKLEKIANAGVSLLRFTIGLKLKLK